VIYNAVQAGSASDASRPNASLVQTVREIGSADLITYRSWIQGRSSSFEN